MENIAIKNLSFVYPGSDKRALSGITADIPCGSFTLITGESGSGKTTLLKLLKKEIAPVGEKSGAIEIAGRDLYDIPFDKTGFVGQSPEEQIVTDKVWHELAFGLENMGLPSGEIRLRVGETAAYFGIGKWYRSDTDTLSGGQKQLLNLAAVMAMRPDILLLDEPTSQLDPVAASDFLDTLKKINAELGVTVIMTEHRLEEVFPMADKVIVLSDGVLAANAAPSEVCLTLGDSSLFPAFPTPARLWYGLDRVGNCPLTVRDARNMISLRFPSATGTTPHKENGCNGVAVELKDIYFRYSRNSQDIISDLSLTVNKGEIFAILGENGSGKSTLLRIISRLEKQYSGDCRIFGKSTKSFKGGDLFRNTVALLPQDPKLLFAGNTVAEDLKSSLELSGTDGSEFESRANKWIDLFGIRNLLARHPYDLSGGEQQKCALVKLLIRQPSVLLLDEATKGMDCAFKISLRRILRRLSDEGITTVAVTHDIEFAAMAADRCGLLFDGKILAADSPDRFFSGNTFYTTAAARIARGRFGNTVSCDDIINLCKGTEQA